MAELAPKDILLQSAEDGDQKRVLNALKANADIKCINESNETPLHLAAKKGHLEIVEILLAKGANATYSSTDKNKWSPLDVAVKEGHEKIAKLLVEKGCPVTNTAMKFATQAGLISTIKFVIENNDIDLAECVDENDGRTLLHHAAEYGYTDVVELFLNGKRRVDTNCKDFFRTRPIHLAVQKGNITIIQMLVDHNADVNCKDLDGMTPLHYGFKTKNQPVVEHLLYNCEANPNICDKDNRSILHFAVDTIKLHMLDKSISIFEVLARKADVNIKDKDGNTPLLYAVLLGHTALQYAKKEERFKNDPMSRVKIDETALHFIIRLKFSSHFYKLLLNRGADLKICDADGYTALYYAAMNKDYDLVEYLNAKGADIKVKDVNGLTLLHHAAIMNSYRLTDLVLANKKLDVNMACKKGNSALHYAAMNETEEEEDDEYCNEKKWICLLLINKGAQINCKNEQNGMTPLLYAVSKKYTEIAKVIIKASKQQAIEKNILQATNKSKMSALHIAIANKDEDIITGKTALHYAVEGNHKNEVVILLDKGADLFLEDKDGHSSLYYAIKNKFFSIYKVFFCRASKHCDIIDGHRISGWLPIHYVIQYDNFSTFCLMVEKCIALDTEMKDHLLLDSSDDDRTALHYAVMNNHFDSVVFLIENGCNINCQDRLHEKTALHYAVESLDIQSFELLINSQAIIVNKKDWKSMTPLHFAAQLGCADMVQRLLDRNADINCRNMFDVTPLHFVCDSKDSHKDILQLLLEAGADPHLKELRFQHTPLHKAAIRGHFEIISILLTKALKINDKCQLVIKLPWKKRRMHSFNWGIFYEIICEYHESKTALHLAAENGHAKAIEVLLNHNASIDIAESETSKTALHLAAENGHKSVVKVLVERGANLRKKDYANKIPFHYAIKHHKKDKELIELLTIDNFNLDLFDEDYDEIHDAGVCGRLDILKLYDESDIFYSPDQFGRTIFHYAAENGDLNLVQYLLTVKCQQPKGYCHSETRDIFGYTPLYFAVSKGHSDIVLCILQSDKQKVDKDRKYGYYNQTLLHIAAEKGFTNIVKYFLHSKYYSFSVDGKLNPLYDRNDKTPLHIAAEKGYEEIVQLLLENGASIHIKDCVSYTPLHYGVESGKTKIVELLLQKGFPLRLRWHEESWNKAITNVACKGHTEVIEFLIQTGELNIMPSAQCTAPLHHAIIYCQKEMISLLLSYIDISASLKFGPMHVAAEHGLIDIAELLRKHGISADDGDN
uniref:Uncharacterized protein n=1 Tax=Amphimedon queenslandica TaxID=400682 RepID=A0A1X7USM4_AMPQE